MADSLSILRRSIKNVEDLRAVVKTMKAMSAATITQFEQAIISLQDYYRSVELALSVSFRETPPSDSLETQSTVPPKKKVGMVVLGSDQGMVGQFNEEVAAAASQHLTNETYPIKLWVVGERVQTRLENLGQGVAKAFQAPQAIDAIAPLVSALLLEIESEYTAGEVTEVIVFRNLPHARSNYTTAWKRILPLDEDWRREVSKTAWPTNTPRPEMLDSGESAQASLISEYLFVSLYQLCAESSTAENAARLTAMQRAEKNIDDRRDRLALEYNHTRQSIIDEELFDLISGFEMLSGKNR